MGMFFTDKNKDAKYKAWEKSHHKANTAYRNAEDDAEFRSLPGDKDRARKAYKAYRDSSANRPEKPKKGWFS